MLRDKKEVRSFVLAKRAELHEEARKKKSLDIQNIVLAMPELIQAQTIMLFMDFRNEVETDRLVHYVLNAKKRLVLPRCASEGELILYHVQDLEENIEIGKWGIREPKEDCPRITPQEIDFVLVPGVAFDKDGNRLGYGGGYYDRFMKKLRGHVPRIGVAFQCQIVDHIPTEPFDLKITTMVTEKGIYCDQDR